MKLNTFTIKNLHQKITNFHCKDKIHFIHRTKKLLNKNKKNVKVEKKLTLNSKQVFFSRWIKTNQCKKSKSKN